MGVAEIIQERFPPIVGQTPPFLSNSYGDMMYWVYNKEKDNNL